MGRQHRELQLQRRLPPSAPDRSKASTAAAPAAVIETSPGHAAPQDFEPVPLGAQAVKVMEAGAGRKACLYWNDGPDVAYRGGQGVSASNGIPILPDQGFVDDLAPNGELYMVSAGTSTMRRQVLK